MESMEEATMGNITTMDITSMVITVKPGMVDIIYTMGKRLSLKEDE